MYRIIPLSVKNVTVLFASRCVLIVGRMLVRREDGVQALVPV